MWQKTKNFYHLLIGILANIIHRFPSKNFFVIGVTGTDGKTTTASLTYHILKEAGYSVSLISTVEAVIHDKTLDTGFHVTTPSSLKLQKLLSEIMKNKKEKEYLVLEVTSHSIDQNRIWGIPFAIGVLTNISHEHLDYHKTYESYVKTKVKLLNRAKLAVINIDDESYSSVEKYLTNKNVYTYSIYKNARITPKDLSIPKKIVGLYNTYNVLAAAGVANDLGISFGVIDKALSTFSFPKGRTEIVYSENFKVMVDFAHTPNALEQLLLTLKPEIKGRLIHVFGSAGLRDKSKRPLMGNAASMYDDIIILTAEDPRIEKIEEINEQIKKGIIPKKNIKIFSIPNRQDAIDYAISIAEKDDFVVITGKGHEKSINYGKGEEAWSEFDAVKKALLKYKHE